MSGAQMLSCTYGYEVTTSDDYMRTTVEEAGLHLGRAILPSSEQSDYTSIWSSEASLRFSG